MERKRQADRRSGRISELAQKSVTQLSQYQKGVNGLRDEKVRAVLTLLLVAAREREHRRARCVARLHGTRAVTMSFRFDPPLFSRNSFFLLQRAGVAEVLIESR